MRFLLGLSTFASLVAFAVARSLEVRHEPSFAKRYAHHRVARDLDRPLTNEVAVVGARDLEKRFEGSRFTFYDAGQGSCGKTNVNSDFIVALNAIQYDGANPSHCFEMITITINGVTVSAQIMDRCEGCPYGGLDFSHGLFNHFAADSVGVLTGSWYFGSGGGTPATTPVTTPTTTYIQPTPTTTYVQPSPTTSRTPTVYLPSPSSSSSSVWSSLSSSTPLRSSTSSALYALSSSSPNATNSTVEGVLEQLNLALVNIGAIIVAGRTLD